MTSVACSHRNNYIFRLNQIACSFKVCNPRLSALVSVHSLVFACKRIHSCILIHACRHIKAMSFAHFKVIRVCSRCNLNRTCTLFRVRMFICYNRDFSIDKRYQHCFAYQILVSLIIGMHRNSHIGKHSLRS